MNIRHFKSTESINEAKKTTSTKPARYKFEGETEVDLSAFDGPKYKLLADDYIDAMTVDKKRVRAYRIKYKKDIVVDIPHCPGVIRGVSLKEKNLGGYVEARMVKTYIFDEDTKEFVISDDERPILSQTDRSVIVGGAVVTGNCNIGYHGDNGTLNKTQTVIFEQDIKDKGIIKSDITICAPRGDETKDSVVSVQGESCMFEFSRILAYNSSIYVINTTLNLSWLYNGVTERSAIRYFVAENKDPKKFEATESRSMILMGYISVANSELNGGIRIYPKNEMKTIEGFHNVYINGDSKLRGDIDIEYYDTNAIEITSSSKVLAEKYPIYITGWTLVSGSTLESTFAPIRLYGSINMADGNAEGKVIEFNRGEKVRINNSTIYGCGCIYGYISIDYASINCDEVSRIGCNNYLNSSGVGPSFIRAYNSHYKCFVTGRCYIEDACVENAEITASRTGEGVYLKRGDFTYGQLMIKDGSKIKGNVHIEGPMLVYDGAEIRDNVYIKAKPLVFYNNFTKKFGIGNEVCGPMITGNTLVCGNTTIEAPVLIGRDRCRTIVNNTHIFYDENLSPRDTLGNVGEDERCVIIGGYAGTHAGKGVVVANCDINISSDDSHFGVNSSDMRGHPMLNYSLKSKKLSGVKIPMVYIGGNTILDNVKINPGCTNISDDRKLGEIYKSQGKGMIEFEDITLKNTDRVLHTQYDVIEAISGKAKLTLVDFNDFNDF